MEWALTVLMIQGLEFFGSRCTRSVKKREVVFHAVGRVIKDNPMNSDVNLQLPKQHYFLSHMSKLHYEVQTSSQTCNIP